MNETANLSVLEANRTANSNPNSTQSSDAFYTYSAPVTVVLCSVYSIVFVIGIIGNSFVVAVVYRAPRMRTVTSFFIANLALADILVIVFCLPVNLIANIVTPWILGEFVCKALSYLQFVSVSASIYTLVAISVDKFIAIYFMRREITGKACRIIIIFIWLYSLILATPWAAFFKLKSTAGRNDKFCEQSWPIEGAADIYFYVANLFMCYLFPLLIITLCYVMIFVKVWKRKLPGDSSTRSASIIAHRSKIKVIKMVVTVCVLFALSWLPLYATSIRSKTANISKMTEFEYKILQAMVPVSQWLGVSNSCVNPIIYAFFNQKFRAGFKAILLDRNCCGTLRYDFAGNRSTVCPSVMYTVKIPTNDTK